MAIERDAPDPADTLARQADDLEARTERLGEHLQEAREKLEDPVAARAKREEPAADRR
jgi:hypothetical protein